MADFGLFNRTQMPLETSTNRRQDFVSAVKITSTFHLTTSVGWTFRLLTSHTCFQGTIFTSPDWALTHQARTESQRTVGLRAATVAGFR